jgi:hypothetical protein
VAEHGAAAKGKRLQEPEGRQGTSEVEEELGGEGEASDHARER